jgi:menaquinone-dependent protoporphyrinogen oxidase
MSRILILYATVEGHTARIASRMAQRLHASGHLVEALPIDIGVNKIDFAHYDGMIIGGSIHYGRHSRGLHSMVHRNRASLETRPNAFFSVSLSAGGPGARPAAAKRYLDKFLHKARWRPQLSATFAGALQYSKYSAFKRLLMALFVGAAGGETDTSRDYEYTDWNAVDEFAGAFATRLRAR